MATIATAKPQVTTSSNTYAAWESPAFRQYFLGQLVSVSGTWLQAVALQVVVYDLTRSELALGLVACTQGIPALFLTPIGGVLVERFSRRKILIATNITMMLMAFILSALQFAGITQVWHIVALSIVLGIANSIDAPARMAFVVEMVGNEQLTSGIVLNSILMNSARIVGPAIGGIALKTIGASWCFFFNGLSFVAVLASLLMMVVPRPRPGIKGPIKILQPLKEGLQFVRRHPLIRPLLLMAWMNSMFSVTFSVLLPSFADNILHDTKGGTAALTALYGAGAVIAGFAVSYAKQKGFTGRALRIFALAGPLFLIEFAFSRGYLLALPLILLCGLFLLATFIMMNSTIQNIVPDDFRGRVMSLYTLTWAGFNPFASLAIGALGQQIGTVSAMVLFAVIALLGNAYLLWRNPELQHLE